MSEPPADDAAPDAAPDGAPAARRDRRRALVDLAVGAGARVPAEYAAGVDDAIATAGWAATVDPADPLVVTMLRVAGELGVAAALSATSAGPSHVVVDGRRREVPPGLAPELSSAAQWVDLVWVATAVADAATAVRLARSGPGVAPEAVPVGDLALAGAVAALWRGDDVGPDLVAAVRAADPDVVPDQVERDRRLDLVIPPAAALRVLWGGTDDPGPAVAAAAAAHVEFHDAYPDPDDTGAALSLPVGGVARLVVEAGHAVPAAAPGLPVALLDPRPTTIRLCALCASPFHDADDDCSWCGADLDADAPTEITVGDYLDVAADACPVCAATTRLIAFRCWRCRSALPR